MMSLRELQFLRDLRKTQEDLEDLNEKLKLTVAQAERGEMITVNFNEKGDK